MNSIFQEYTGLIQSGDPSHRGKRILSKVISLIEDGHAGEILDLISSHGGRADRIGFTGPPGSGKSTLVGVVAKAWAEQSKKIGIIAVDPTSPFTGGAILGDRLRMNDAALHPNIFIRSMATRGSRGGLVKTAYQTADAMDAYGMDVILFETVGVGQSEIDIVRHADTTVVVLVPESGDGVQAMKAGLMEIADVFVINKADHVQADFIKKELEAAVELRARDAAAWIPKVTKTIAIENVGTELVLKLIHDHKDYLIASGRWEERRKERIRHELFQLVDEKIQKQWTDLTLDEHVEKIIQKKESVHNAANEIYNRLFKTT